MVLCIVIGSGSDMRISKRSLSASEIDLLQTMLPWDATNDAQDVLSYLMEEEDTETADAAYNLLLCHETWSAVTQPHLTLAGQYEVILTSLSLEPLTN